MFQRELCTDCGECFSRCQYMGLDLREAKEEMGLLKAGSSRVLSLCATCAACNGYCSRGARPFDLILQRREETGATWGSGGFVNWFGPASVMPSYVRRGDPDRPALSLCTVEHRLPHPLGGPLFEGMSTMKGGDFFCWIGLFHLGKREAAEPLLRRTVENIASTGFRDVVFLHDECYAAMRHACKEFGIEVPFRFRHVVDYLLEYATARRASLRKLDLPVAVQIPCSQRYAGTMQEIQGSLDRLFELLGVTRPRRRHDYADGLCCNVAIGHPSRLPQLDQEMTSRNLQDMVDAGARAMVCVCPVCVQALARPAQRHGLPIYMPHDLVRLALGETLPAPNIVPIDWKKLDFFLSHWRLFTLRNRLTKYWQKLFPSYRAR